METQYSQNPKLQGWQPTNGRDITIIEVLCKEWGIWAHIEPPSPGILHQEDEPLECLALKTSRAYV